MAYEPVKVGTIKLGRYVIHPDDNEVYKVISVDHSKPGKHGSAKARMVLQNAFTGSKKQFISPVDKRINIPVIDKRMAQVTNVTGDSIALMDNETYDTFEASLPIEEALRKKLLSLFEAGKGIEVEYWEVMNRKKIQEVRELEL
ncbi:MAG: translation initiation factor IF-5A [Candidatus Heimdallarchaeota archaeon]